MYVYVNLHGFVYRCARVCLCEGRAYVQLCVLCVVALVRVTMHAVEFPDMRVQCFCVRECVWLGAGCGNARAVIMSDGDAFVSARVYAHVYV